MRPMAARRIVFVAFDDFQILDVTGPHEVFSTASSISGGSAYELEVGSTPAAYVESQQEE